MVKLPNYTTVHVAPSLTITVTPSATVTGPKVPAFLFEGMVYDDETV